MRIFGKRAGYNRRSVAALLLLSTVVAFVESFLALNELYCVEKITEVTHSKCFSFCFFPRFQTYFFRFKLCSF